MSVSKGIAGAAAVSSDIALTHVNVMLTDSEIGESWMNSRREANTAGKNDRHFEKRFIQTA
jgi:hypothetical protein